MGKLQIDVLGASFTISSDENDAYLSKILEYYKLIVSNIEQGGNIKDPLKVSILAGISLVDELYKEKGKSVSYSKVVNSPENTDAERKTMEIIEKINQALQ